MRPKELDHAVVLEEEARACIDAAPDLPSARRGLDELLAGRSAVSVPDDVEVEPVDEGAVVGEWVETPFESGGRVLILVEGRGFAFTSASHSRELAGRLARASHALVLSLGQRAAPEDPHPAARDDVIAAVRLLVADGVDHRKIGLVGVSTGAGAVLSAAIELRALGEVGPGAIALLSPVVDLAADLAGDDPIGAAELIARHRDAYLGPTDAEDPGVSPARGDLSGLPPMLIQAGGADPAAGQARALAERAEAAGVEVAHSSWDGAVHAFQRFPHIRETGVATNEVGDWLLQRLGPAYVPVPFESEAA